MPGGFTYADWEQYSLPRAVNKLKPALLHCTANTAPFFVRTPLILTLHDIIYLEENNLRGSAYQNAGNMYRRLVVPAAVKSAAAIITVSEFEKGVIEKRFPGAAGKISVIYNGVDERFHQRFPEEKAAMFRQKYSLPAQFILFLGNSAPKKNTANVVKAYIHYRELEKDPLPIVIADYSSAAVQKILREIGRPGLISSFVFPGYIPSEEMQYLYNCSALFLYPSLRESFGLPLVEAMACGVPVITSNTSAMPEIAGGAAVLVDPEDYKQIGGKIRDILADSSLRSSCVQKGLERARMFNWDDSADKLLKIYSDHQH